MSGIYIFYLHFGRPYAGLLLLVNPWQRRLLRGIGLAPSRLVYIYGHRAMSRTGAYQDTQPNESSVFTVHHEVRSFGSMSPDESLTINRSF